MQLVRCVSESTDDLVVEHTVVINSVFIVHVFSVVTVAKAAVWKGIKCVVFVWAWPRFLVGLLPWRRNASLAGGFAGRCFVVLFF